MRTSPALLLLALAAPLVAADVERPLVDGWRFLRGEAAGAQAPAFDDGAWRTLRLPHDASIEALPSGTAAAASIDGVTGTWRYVVGDDAGWSATACDDQGWKTATLPASLKGVLGNAPENTVVWFRRTLPAGVPTTGAVLLLGPVDDADETWVNGVKVGATGGFPPAYQTAWEEERRYAIPAGLLKGDGTDVVAVRCYNGGSDGGLYRVGTPGLRVGPFDTALSAGQGATGYTVGTTCWYRRTFDLTPEMTGRRVVARFGGAYRNATVWLNGAEVASRAYGYSEFEADLTAHLKPTGNVLAVRTTNEGRNSRWYAGSGLHREVTLLVSDALHLVSNGLVVTTRDEGPVTQVAVAVEVGGDAPAGTQVEVLLRDAAGAEAGRATATVAAGKAAVTIPLTKARRWSVEDPHCYTAEAVLRRGSKVADRDRTTFGVRTVRVSTAGLTIDGKPVKLQGGCVHHDNGLLGAAALPRADERRVELLKARGFNAVRCAHNPPSRAFLAACDRLGMLVMDETFDMWNEAKNPEDYHRDFPVWAERDAADLVRRDRNHPSVIMWSIGNEIPEQYKPLGIATAKRLKAVVQAHDATRPVTQALNGFDADGHPKACAVLDVAGYNYRNSFTADLKEHPARIMVSTESFPLHASDAWYAAVDCPAAIGDFVWTAFDYLGEAGCGFLSTKDEFYRLQPFPMYTGNTGDLDLCGFQRPQSLFRDVLWGVRPAAIVVRIPRPEGAATKPNPWGWPDVTASWNWPGQLHQPMTVEVYADGEVELRQDGAVIGRQPATRAQKHVARFTVPWRPGTLTATVLKNGQPAGTADLATTGQPAALRLTADRTALAAHGDDLSYVTVEVVDAAGRRVPDAQVPVALAVTGEGHLAAAGNGNAMDAASFRSTAPLTHEGRCLAIVRADRAGKAVLTANAAGLPPVTLTITAR